MKEVEKVSLGGYAFTLDTDAAEFAAGYLGELERFYAGREGGGEILEGIEERMAELLREKCGQDGVVSKPMIEGIIAILGRPEEIEGVGAPEGDAGSAAGTTKEGLSRNPPARSASSTAICPTRWSQACAAGWERISRRTRCSSASSSP